MNNVYSDDPEAGPGISKKPKWVYGFMLYILSSWHTVFMQQKRADRYCLP